MSIGDVAERVLKKADPAGKRHGARAVAAWAEVVGPEIARHTRGFAVREGGELVVFVDGNAWANQLALMSEDLRSALNSHIGSEQVRSLRFTVSRKVAEERQWMATQDAAEGFYETADAPPVPLDDTEREQAVAIARSVKDPDLREVALRVMIKDLERKKGERQRAASGASEDAPDEAAPGASQH